LGNILREIEARRDALNRLRSLVKYPETVLIVHYSCESFFERVDGTSPRINSISVRFLGSGQHKAFSIHLLAEREHIPIDEISENYSILEKALLDEFYGFVEKYKDFKWLHWSMSFVNYGFPALAHRYQVLGGKPISIPDTNLIDLAAHIKAIYGRNYIPRPPLNNLILKNNLQSQQLLTGKEEAYAIEAGKYIIVSQSTETKTYILSVILYKVVDQILKTDASILKWKLKNVRACIELFMESLFFKIVLIIAAIASIIGAIFLFA
jgi:hypothetical protein